MALLSFLRRLKQIPPGIYEELPVCLGQVFQPPPPSERAAATCPDFAATEPPSLGGASSPFFEGLAELLQRSKMVKNGDFMGFKEVFLVLVFWCCHTFFLKRSVLIRLQGFFRFFKDLFNISPARISHR